VFSDFLGWTNTVVEAPPVGALDCRLTQSQPSDNNSARLDFDTETTVNRITVWESGRYVVESIEFESGNTIFERSGACTFRESGESIVFFNELIAEILQHGKQI
jgi:hypothetical protein